MPSLSLSSFPVSGKAGEKALYIQNMLELAKDARTHIFLDFTTHNKNSLQLKGSCREVGKGLLYIYLREEAEQLPHTGMRVNAYFSLHDRQRVMPFSFNTTLLGVKQDKRDKYLVLSMPESVEHRQRRDNVRISVNKHDIDDFKIWFGTPNSSAEVKSGKMHWTLIHPDQAEVYDISAGGMRIGISKDSPAHSMLSRQAMFLISGNFFIKEKDASPLLLAGHAVRLQHTHDRSHAVLGIQYRQWARVREEGLHWINLTAQDGVAPLATWVFRTIMERSRKEHEGM